MVKKEAVRQGLLPVLLADTFPVFRWGASGHLFKCGTETAFAGKSGSKADFFDCRIGGF